MTRTAIVLVMVGTVALVVSGRDTPSYIWNSSESVPIGLYRLLPLEQLAVTQLVAIRPPELLETFLDLNGYLPVGVPMLKRILALPGQTVCRTGTTITVDDVDMGRALTRDSRGRPLPTWTGCHLVSGDEIFVMNWQSANSLDGRYFGPIPASAVIGRALPVWTKGE